MTGPGSPSPVIFVFEPPGRILRGAGRCSGILRLTRQDAHTHCGLLVLVDYAIKVTIASHPLTRFELEREVYL